MSQHRQIIKATIEYICPMAFSRIFLRETFCKLLSKHLWQCLHLINFHASSIFLWKSLDGCIQVWKLFLWRNLFLRLKQHSVSCLKLKKPHCKNIRRTIKAGVYSFKSSDSGPFSKNRNYTQNLFDAKQSSTSTNI